ncbi:MAG: hypothetical protein WCK73_04140 [Deltaproteobacteria bacterium]
MRLKALFSMAVIGYAGLAFAQAAPAQTTVIEEKKTETVTVVVKETPKPPAFVFELHGFASVAGYFQDALFGAGQGGNALFVSGVAGKAYDTDKPIFGFDIRQTRLNFSVRGPAVLGGAVPKAVVELDFYGSSEVATVGGFSDVSVLPRLRTAYVELNWNEGRHILQLGQQNMLTIGVIPQSLSHIAFPATYTAGTVGWRQPGFWGWHTFGDDLKFEFAWSIQRSGWANSIPTPDGQNAGITSGLPAFEARGKLIFGKMFNVWVSGHWQTVDRNGNNAIAVPAQYTDMVTALGTVGFNGNIGPIALAGSAWWGKNTGPLLGNILQFAPAAYFGDIWGYGAWVQGGFNVTKNLSLWYTFGVDHPSYQDLFDVYQALGAAGQAAMPRMRNMTQVVMARYQDGGFAMGAEWQYTRTVDIRSVDPLLGNQITITGNYYF